MWRETGEIFKKLRTSSILPHFTSTFHFHFLLFPHAFADKSGEANGERKPAPQPSAALRKGGRGRVLRDAK